MLYDIKNLVQENKRETISIIKEMGGRIDFTALEKDMPKKEVLSDVADFPNVIVRVDSEPEFSVFVLAVKTSRIDGAIAFLCYDIENGKIDWLGSDLCVSYSENCVYSYISGRFGKSVPPFAKQLRLECQKKMIQKSLDDNEISIIKNWLRNVFVANERPTAVMQIVKGYGKAKLIQECINEDGDMSELNVHYSKVDAIKEFLTAEEFNFNVNYNEYSDGRSGRIIIKITDGGADE